MRAPISVIIPTLNAETRLPHCLAALAEGLNEGVIRELILSDGGSVDGTLAIAEQAGAEIVQGPPSRGGQLRRGAEAAQGEWLLFVHADTVLQPGWSAPVLQILHGQGAYYFQLRFDARGLGAWWVARWANLRSRWFGLPYGDQGLLIHRDTYKLVGGYDDIPLMEDVALAQALKGHLSGLDGIAQTSAEKYQKQGWLRRGGRNLWTLLKFFAGVSPSRLVQSYDKGAGAKSP